METQNNNDDTLKEKKKQVIKDIVKKKVGPNKFDPNPELKDSETTLKT